MTQSLPLGLCPCHILVFSHHPNVPKLLYGLFYHFWYLGFYALGRITNHQSLVIKAEENGVKFQQVSRAQTFLLPKT